MNLSDVMNARTRRLIYRCGFHPVVTKIKKKSAKIREENRCAHHVYNRSFPLDHETRAVVSLIIKRQGRERERGEGGGKGKKRGRRKIEECDTLLGHLFGMPLAPSLTPLRLPYFFLSLFLFLIYFSAHHPSTLSLAPSPQRSIALSRFSRRIRKVRCSVLVVVFPPFRVRSEGAQTGEIKKPCHAAPPITAR